MTISFTDTGLTNMMFLAALMIATGGLKAIYGGWFVRETEAWSRIVATQRKRYVITAIGAALSIIPGYGLLAMYGITAYRAGIHEWTEVGLIGWIVAAAMWYTLFSPLLVLLTVRHIRRHPSELAKKVRGGWVKTQDVRLGISPPRIYVVVYGTTP